MLVVHASRRSASGVAHQKPQMGDRRYGPVLTTTCHPKTQQEADLVLTLLYSRHMQSSPCTFYRFSMADIQYRKHKSRIEYSAVQYSTRRLSTYTRHDISLHSAVRTVYPRRLARMRLGRYSAAFVDTRQPVHYSIKRAWRGWHLWGRPTMSPQIASFRFAKMHSTICFRTSMVL